MYIKFSLLIFCRCRVDFHVCLLVVHLVQHLFEHLSASRPSFLPTWTLYCKRSNKHAHLVFLNTQIYHIPLIYEMRPWNHDIKKTSALSGAWNMFTTWSYPKKLAFPTWKQWKQLTPPNNSTTNSLHFGCLLPKTPSSSTISASASTWARWNPGDFFQEDVLVFLKAKILKNIIYVKRPYVMQGLFQLFCFVKFNILKHPGMS